MRTFLLLCLVLFVSLASSASAAYPQTRTREPLSLQHVPQSTVFFLSVHPSELLKHRSLKLMADEFNGWLRSSTGIAPAELESWSFILCFREVKNNRRAREAMIQIFVSEKPNDFKTFLQMFPTTSQKEHKGTRYQVAGRAAYRMIDERTLLFAQDEPTMKLAIEAGPNGSVHEPWKRHWETVRIRPAAAMIDFANFRKAIENNPPPPGIFTEIKGMWEHSEVVAIGLSTDGKIRATATAESKSEADAEKALTAIKIGASFLAENLKVEMKQVERQVTRIRAREDNSWNRYQTELEVMGTLLPLAEKPLENFVAEQEGKLLKGSTNTSPIAIARTSGRMAQIFRRLWEQQLAVARVKNLRQIGIAMHNYHDAYKRFPAAAQMGADGKGEHPVSWRVLLLPFLEHAAMYEAYRFDEPWDSPHNKKVTAKMPSVYRAAGSPAADGETDYFVFVGDEAPSAFAANKGRTMQEMMDGTSNVLLVAETRKPVHWAKPEDIVIKDVASLPKLGGIVESGFYCARADGATVFVSSDADKNMLWNFLIINDQKSPDPSFFKNAPPAKAPK